MKLSKSEVVGEIIAWVGERLESKGYGSFGIEVVLHDGYPVSVEKSDRLNYRREADGVIPTE